MFLREKPVSRQPGTGAGGGVQYGRVGLAGIAFYIGQDARHIGESAVVTSLSFEGDEITGACRCDGFLAVSVRLASCGQGATVLVENDRTVMLLDGNVFSVEENRLERERGNPVPPHLLCELLEDEGVSPAARLNGSFTVAFYRKEARTVSVVTDRFGSRPLFYSRGSGGMGFSSRVEGLEAMGMNPCGSLRPEGLAQLLTMGMVFTDDTLWEGVKSAPGGSIITATPGGARVERYHRIGFQYVPGESSVDEDASRLAETLTAAIRLRVPRSGAGLLLSGGLDSRMVLACSDAPVTAFTLADRENLEFRVARRLARIAGIRHVAVSRDPYHYVDMVGEASRVCEGAFDYSHDHFEGLWKTMLAEPVDAMVHGSVLDRMLRGIRLPLRTLKVRGYSGHVAVLEDVAWGDVVPRMIKHLSRVEEPLRPLKADARSISAGMVERELECFVDRERGSVIEPRDYFELFSVPIAGRWVAFPMNLGVRHHADERCVAFDNELLEVLLRTPPKHRVNSVIYLKALTLINPRMARVLDANRYLPADLRLPPRVDVAWRLGAITVSKGARAKALSARGPTRGALGRRAGLVARP